jgi:hypothetical protein
VSPWHDLWLAPLGFLAGVLGLALSAGWLRRVAAAVGRPSPASPPAAPERRRPALLAVILHPVPWLLLLGLAFGLPRVVASPARAAWLMFLAGALGAVALNALLVWVAPQRARRHRATRRAPKASGGDDAA